MEIWGEFRRYGLFKSNNAPGEFGRYARAETRAISGVMSGKELRKLKKKKTIELLSKSSAGLTFF